jgi:uncharacterized BrkB/YihY/UPF0761 family membrane protein
VAIDVIVKRRKIMKNLMRIVRMSIALGALSLVSLVVGYLALNAIAQGEGDLHTEWMVLRVTAVLVVMFHALAMVSLYKVLRTLAHGE